MQLIKALKKAITRPLHYTYQKEGESHMLYALKKGGEDQWEAIESSAGKQILHLFEVFHDKIDELTQSNTCSCDGCQNTSSIKLKIFAHNGKIVVNKRYFHTPSLEGKDAILIKHLANQSVGHSDYLLMTLSAFNELKFPFELDVLKSREKFHHNEIPAYIYLPELRETKKHYDTWFYRVKNKLLKWLSHLC